MCKQVCKRHACAWALILYKHQALAISLRPPVRILCYVMFGLEHIGIVRLI